MAALSKSVMSKRIRIYTAEDVATHSKVSSCWVSRAGKVYDVTGFLDDHPGGDDLILQYGGKDIEEAMKDKLEHNHSDSAYNMLEGLVIGRLGIGEAVVREGSFFLLFLAPRHQFLPGWNRLGGPGWFSSGGDRFSSRLWEERVFRPS